MAGVMVPLSTTHWVQALPALAAIVLPFAAVAIRSARAEGGAMTPGFKGWLFVLGAWVWLTLLRGLFEFALVAGDPIHVGRRLPWLLGVDLLIAGITVALSGLCVVLMLRRAAAFRTVFPLVAAWLVLTLPISVLCAHFVWRVVYASPIGFVGPLTAVAGDLPRWAVGLAVTMAWVTYVRRSRRVAITFAR